MTEEPNQGELESHQSEDEISKGPGAHADHQNPFKAESGDTKRKDRHEKEFRELVEGRQGNRRRITGFAQVGNHGREEVVASKNTDHKRTKDEDGKSGRFEHGQSPKAKDVLLRPFGGSALGWGIGEGEGVKSEEDTATTANKVEIRTGGATRENFHDQIHQDPASGPKNKDFRRRSRIRNMFENDGVD